MSAQIESPQELPRPLPGYHSILLALDSSDHANQGTRDAIGLAGLWNAKITGTHVYAAKMHDTRFRQMEGGLPEQFREEQELERQRDVHDDLISRGLSIITDSYLDQAETACSENKLQFVRRSLEGKNYRALSKESNSGDYDLLVIGALGLGAIPGSRVGTVCERVVRRTDIDTLIIKDTRRSVSDGPIVVAVDGSSRSFGGLLTALSLAQQWQVAVKIVSAFDPYYHYVAFNRIAGVLSEEAGKVFRFQEQEKLHEEIIDSGLAKIYAGHLTVAQSIAADYGVEVETKLLDGKPHDAIEKYLRKIKPSLLIIGKLGIHADPELDIGGNAENLLRNVDCSLLLSQREYQPPVDTVAEATISWTHEAEARMSNIPSFVKNMARTAILRYAQEQGHTVITARIVEEATARLRPGHAENAMTEIVQAHDNGELKRSVTERPMLWSGEAEALLDTIEDLSLRNNLKMRAEKKARADGTNTVAHQHLAAFLDGPDAAGKPAGPPHWQAAALARLMQAPEGFMRETSRQRIEEYTRSIGATEVTPEIAAAGLAKARKAMQAQAETEGGPAANGGQAGKCPFAGTGP